VVADLPADGAVRAGEIDRGPLKPIAPQPVFDRIAVVGTSDRRAYERVFRQTFDPEAGEILRGMRRKPARRCSLRSRRIARP
jgi:hypothetical protein